MIIRITLEEKNRPINDIWREYSWEIDGDYDSKGRIIEEMMTELKRPKEQIF